MTDMMDIGISSILAVQTALNVASNNIANASDPTFSRRAVTFAESASGRGVDVADVSRVVNASSIQYAQASNMNFSELDTYSSQLQTLVSLFGNDSAGIGAAITNTLGALRNLSNPNSSGLRNSYLDSLTAASQRMQTVSGQITTALQNTDQSIVASVDVINHIVSNIAEINNQIQLNQGQDQNNLLDQRDGLVDQLSTYLDFTTQTDSKGVMSINLSNGMQLVDRTNPATLTTFVDPSNSENLLVGMKNGSITMDLSNIIKGGQIAGLYSFRKDAEQAQIGLGRLALAFQDSLNAQNKLGIDANGEFGGNIFTDINSSTAISSRAWGSQTNVGTSGMTVNITDVTQLKLSDYKLTVGSGNSYVLKRVSDNTVVSSGTISGTFPQAINVDGFDLSINSGTFTAGDTYTISPTKSAAETMNVEMTDGSKLALGMPVATTPNAQNKGTGVLTVTSITDPSNSSFATPLSLDPPINVVFDATGANYTLINATTLATIEGPIAYNPTTGAGGNIFPTPGGYDPGYRIQITGTVKADDSFSITYNSANSTDFRNGALLQKVYSNQILDGGKSTFNQAYNSVTTNVYANAQSAQSQSDVAKQLKGVADKARDDISGVSLLEESMSLQRFQQAYQASAQVLQSAKSVFDSLMSMFR